MAEFAEASDEGRAAIIGHTGGEGIAGIVGGGDDGEEGGGAAFDEAEEFGFGAFGEFEFAEVVEEEDVF